MGLEERLTRAPSKAIWLVQGSYVLHLIAVAHQRFQLSAERPSTACIGNWGAMEAVARLSACTSTGIAVRARLFMGKQHGGVEVDVPVSRYASIALTPKTTWEVLILYSFILDSLDSPSRIEAEWASLRTEFLRPNTVLLFHLKNHYALIFALREWEESPAGPRNSQQNEMFKSFVSVRQVLTARKVHPGACYVLMYA
jgi:hypothetical protein